MCRYVTFIFGHPQIYFGFRKNIFDSKIAGATPDATKVLVIITDGNPSDSDTKLQSVRRSDEKNIIRFVIGVEPAFITHIMFDFIMCDLLFISYSADSQVNLAICLVHLFFYLHPEEEIRQLFFIHSIHFWQVKDVKLEKLRTLASAPKESNTFHIRDYKGLDSILDKLQNKIFSIEGRALDSNHFTK